MYDMPEGEEDGFVVRLRGLPWAATPEDVVKFFAGCQIVDEENGVHFTFSREGRPSGEAFVEFASEDDVQAAVKKHNEHMGQRYIEVFRSKKSEMDWVIKRSGSTQTTNMNEAVVRLRGLPFGCSKEEIAQFFTGLEIVPNGIMLPEDRQGRSTGEAYVQFASTDIAEKALGKHKERIGHRYIEIFKSSQQEAYNAVGSPRSRPMMGSMGRPGPYDRNDRFGGMGMAMGMGMGMNNMGGGGGGMPMGGYARGRGGRGNVKVDENQWVAPSCRGYYEDEFEDYGGGYGGGMGFGMGNRRGGSPMRGMSRGGRMPPADLGRRGGATPGSHYVSHTGHSVHMRGLPFQALESDILDFFAPLQPVKVEFEFSDGGRPTGEANVDFATHQEAVEAMKKHKCNMQHRYIELFLNSTADTRSSGGFSGPMGGGGGSFSGSTSMGSSMGGFGNGAGSYNGGGGEYEGGMSSYMSGGGGGGGSFGGSGLGGMGGGGSLMGNPNYTAF